MGPPDFADHALSVDLLVDAIQNIPEGFVLCDVNDRLLVCNERYRTMYTGIRELAAPGTPFIEMVRAFYASGLVLGIEQGREEEALAMRMARHRHPGPPFEHELRDGRRIRITEHRTRHGGTVGIHADITDIRRTQERLRYLANHDQLTELPNRAYFLESLERALLRARRCKGRLAVMYLDLDRFKQVNDTLGHHAGDELLRAVAGRLRGHLRDKDTLARLGGDEFMVILEDLGEAAFAESSAKRLIQALAEPFRIDGQAVTITTSIGVAIFPNDGDNVRDLMRNADAAGYCAKARGANNYCVYSPDIDGFIRCANSA